MSELFTSLQQGLRDFKNNHDIDMSHPNGAIVYGKPYPAVKKLVWMSPNHPKNNSTHFYHEFQIPLENGHRVSVATSRSWENENTNQIRSVILIPTKQMFRQPDNKNLISYKYTAMFKNNTELGIPEHLKEHMKGIDAVHVHENSDMFHDYVKSISRLPRFGTAEQYIRNGTKSTFQNERAMTDDELNEHFKNTSLEQEEHPHNIHIYHDDYNDNKIRQHDYNIKTEQLTTDEKWD